MAGESVVAIDAAIGVGKQCASLGVHAEVIKVEKIARAVATKPQ